MSKEKLELTEYQKHMFERWVDHKWFFATEKTTVAVLRMTNGFEIVGTSSCVHKEHFDREMGQHYAIVDALRQMDKFVGFGRQQEFYEHKIHVEQIKDAEEEAKKLLEYVKNMSVVVFPFKEEIGEVTMNDSFEFEQVDGEIVFSDDLAEKLVKLNSDNQYDINRTVFNEPLKEVERNGFVNGGVISKASMILGNDREETFHVKEAPVREPSPMQSLNEVTNKVVFNPDSGKYEVIQVN